MGQHKTTLVWGCSGEKSIDAFYDASETICDNEAAAQEAAIAAGTPEDELPEFSPDYPEIAGEIGETLGVDFAQGQRPDWIGYVVPEESDVYGDFDPLDVAALVAGEETPLRDRLAACRAAWDELRLRLPDAHLPEGRLLLVGDHEVA